MRFFLILFLFLPIIDSYGQVVDVPPRGKENYQVYMGGARQVDIDWETPLEELIKRFEGEWHFGGTGKAYWIGYTEDMYSIAARKDTAIQPLLTFIDTTQSLRAKIGAVHSLHLIGINSTIVGRFLEKFQNPKAREVLLSLADDEELSPIAIFLLARDPWRSDLPTLSGILRKDSLNITLLNALFRYTRDDMPFRQDIPEHTDSIDVFLKDPSGTTRLGHLITIYKQQAGDPSEKGNRLNRQEDVMVQWGSEGRILRRFVKDTEALDPLITISGCSKEELERKKCKGLKDLLYELLRLSKEKVSTFSYCHLDEEYFHYVDERGIIICTPDQARLRWLAYFGNQ